ncbi:hypothetical protein AJ79_03899 [Helicocarpus griseus UAMH5409]|uniref:N-acetyltransferase domain-containing protein n=1 Tax=Helicocarpus griseus UAMH5409 TaxID=1447875 RepID=A0A2B7XWQ9_9EURO|nr:hypothetical protein AJ79_03899 [Helicocarpus griseus UAMH5409]
MSTENTVFTDLQHSHASRLASITADAFANDLLFKLECPDDDAIDAMKRHDEASFHDITEGNSSPPNIISVCVVADRITGHVLGYAKWTMFDWSHANMTEDPKIGTATRGSDGNDGLDYDVESPPLSSPPAATLYADISATRRLELLSSKGPYICLEVVAVDPTAQRNGVGSMLVRRAQATAADNKLPIFCEVISKIVPFYLRSGFHVVDSLSLPTPDGYDQAAEELTIFYLAFYPERQHT